MQAVLTRAKEWKSMRVILVDAAFLFSQLCNWNADKSAVTSFPALISSHSGNGNMAEI